MASRDELVAGTSWTCSECGENNMCRPVKARHKGDPHLTESLAKRHEFIGAWQTLDNVPDGFVYWTQPYPISCDHCRVSFSQVKPWSR